MKIYTVGADGKVEEGAKVGKDGRHLYAGIYGLPLDRNDPPVIRDWRVYGCILVPGKPENWGGPQLYLRAGGANQEGALVVVEHSHQDFKWASFKGRHVNLINGTENHGNTWCTLQLTPDTAVWIEQYEDRHEEKQFLLWKWKRFVKQIHHFRVIYLSPAGKLVVFPSREEYLTLMSHVEKS